MAELTLVVGERERFYVNLNYIKDAATKSKWVRAMLKYEECINGEIHLPKTDPVTFKNFMKILSDNNNSSVTGRMEDVMDVLHQSHQWDFSEVVRKCCDYCHRIILHDYTFVFSNIAMLDLENPIDEISLFLLQWNIKEVFKNKWYLNWSTPTWIRFLGSDNIALGEIVIFKSVQKWQKANNVSLWEVRRLMPLIRFSIMKKAKFEKYVPPSGFLQENEIDDIRKQPEDSTKSIRRFELGIHDGIHF